MKKLKMTFLTAMAFLTVQNSFAQSTNPAPYCGAAYNDAGNFSLHYISGVQIGTLNNQTGNTSYAFPHYVYYNNISAPILTAGSNYQLTVTHDPQFAGGQQSTTHWVAVYIDYNHDNDFDDQGELVLSQLLGTGNGVTNPTAGSITIPTDAVAGNTRMRVLVNEDDNIWSPTPCAPSAAFEWGETEDYDVTIANSHAAVTEISSNTAAAIYPNPANDNIFVNEKFVGADLTVTNISGQLLMQTKVSNSKIDISLAEGMYFVRLNKDGKMYTQKLLITK